MYHRAALSLWDSSGFAMLENHVGRQLRKYPHELRSILSGKPTGHGSYVKISERANIQPPVWNPMPTLRLTLSTNT